MKCTNCGTTFEGNFCPTCGKPVGVTPNSPNTPSPTPPVKPKAATPFYKKWWFWTIVVILILIIIGIIGGGSDDGSTNANYSMTQENDSIIASDENSSAQVTVIDFSSMSKSDIEAWASENNLMCEFSEDYSDTIATGSVISQNKNANETVPEGTTIKIVISKGKKPSIEYLNALDKAEIYSNTMHMSKQAIYDQLTSEYGEQFPADAAQYAIDNLNADYKANALAKAKIYQQTMSMSKNAIYDQLVSEYGEQFTAEEAQYAIDHLED